MSRRARSNVKQSALFCFSSWYVCCGIALLAKYKFKCWKEQQWIIMGHSVAMIGES